jgi:hypothetical protein
MIVVGGGFLAGCLCRLGEGCLAGDVNALGQGTRWTACDGWNAGFYWVTFALPGDRHAQGNGIGRDMRVRRVRLPPGVRRINTVVWNTRALEAMRGAAGDEYGRSLDNGFMAAKGVVGWSGIKWI